MEGWMWLILASMFGVGGILGYVLGRSKGDNHQKIRELESSLSDGKKELESYRTEVAQHFGKTAELFNKLTTDYREVYEHLAASSETLCGDQAAKLSAQMPDKKLLDAKKSETTQTASTKVEGANEDKTAPVTEADKTEEERVGPQADAEKGKGSEEATKTVQ